MAATTRQATATQSVSVASNILNARSTEDCTNTISVLVEYVRDTSTTPSQAKKALLEEVCVSDILRAKSEVVRQLRHAMDDKGGSCKMPDVLNARNAIFVYMQQNNGDTISLEEVAKSAASSTAPTQSQTSFEYDPTVKAKTEFAKYYYDENKLYSASLTGLTYSDWKRDLLSNFEYYKIPNEERKNLLERTITGKVKDFYTNNIVPRNVDWKDSIERIGAEFVPDSLRASNLRRFTSYSYQDARRDNPTLSNEQVFDKLVDELRANQKTLSDQYRQEESLRDMVMRAMKGTAYAPFFAIYSSNRSEDLFARIRSVIQSVDGSSLAAKTDAGPSTVLATKDEEERAPEATDEDADAQEEILFQRMLRRFERSKPYKKRFGNFVPKVYGQSLNPLGRDGKPLRCLKCDSKMHLINDCPHSDKNVRRALLTNEDANGSGEEDDTERDENASASHFAEIMDLHRLNPVDVSTDTACSVEQMFLATPVQEREQFNGFCFDNGSSISITSLKQYRAYCVQAGDKPALRKSSKVIRWGQLYPSMGSANVRLPLDQDNMIKFSVEVIDTNDDLPPLILGLDIMEKYGIIISHEKDNPHFVIGNRQYPLIKRAGHLYWELAANSLLHECNLSHEELMAIHKKFGHASSHRIALVFERAKNPLSQEDRAVLSSLVRNCDICQWYNGHPSSYKVSAEIETSFNHTVQADIMYIDQRPLFHIVCKGTRFQSATFIPDKSAATLWKTFFLEWIQLFDYPHRLQIDQDSAMTSAQFRESCLNSGIILDVVPIEAHHSVGIVERYHGVLRTVFLKLRDEQQAISEPDRVGDDLLLAYTVRAMNVSVGLEGFIPSLLVFGTIPKLVLRPEEPSTSQANRISAMLSARKTYEEVVSSHKLKQIQSSQIPMLPDEQQGSLLHQPVLVRREVGYKWTGPYLCTKVDKNKVQVLIPPGGRQADFHINNVKRFVVAPSTPSFFTFLTEEEMTLFEEAKAKEIRNMWNKGTFVFVTAPTEDGILLGARFVLTVKSDASYKARYVAQGHKDPDKASIVTEAPTLSRMGIRFLCHMAASFDMLSSLSYRDYEQAYLQSTSPINRAIYIKVRDEDKTVFTHTGRELKQEVPSGDLYLRLLKPLYGLTEAGTFWYFSLSEKFVQAGFLESALDPCVMFLRSAIGHFLGAVGLVVDDELFFGLPETIAAEHKISSNFINKGCTKLPFTFDGMSFSMHVDILRMSQMQFIKKIGHSRSAKGKTALFKVIAELRGQFIWLASATHPDISFATAQLAQITLSTVDDKHVQHANKLILSLKATAEYSLPYHRISENDAHIRVYADASYATNADLTSQLGFLIFIADDKKMNLVHWQSLKSKVVLHSVLGAEVHALVTALDIAEALQSDYKNMTNVQLPIVLYTDSKSIFDTIAHKSILTEKRLMIKMQMLRQEYETGKVSDVAHVPGTENIANSLTKYDNKAQEVWNHFYATGEINHSVNIWLKSITDDKKK